MAAMVPGIVSLILWVVLFAHDEHSL
jgi:hypothetical protein